MKRWLALLLILVAVLIAAITVHYAWDRHEQRRREAYYLSVLDSYSSDLKPGTTRKNVEERLRSRGATFQKRCCIDERIAEADLIQIGKEKAPWYCGENNVYVAFQFAAIQRPGESAAFSSGTETLRKITIFHWLENCL
jgi:hypothetical protein